MATETGRDLSCTTSIRSGRFASGPLLVAEACYRRLTTPRGRLRGGEAEQNYGFDIRQVVGETNVSHVVATLPGRIRAELLKDERIESVDVEILVVTVKPATRLQITVSAVTSSGPFTLQLLASAVTVELLGIT
jgi:hypothetical protein